MLLQVRVRPEREPDLQTPECLNTAPQMLHSTYIDQFGHRLQSGGQIWMLATPGRLELPAPSLGNLCSILLSYGVTERSINRDSAVAKIGLAGQGQNQRFCAPNVPQAAFWSAHGKQKPVNTGLNDSKLTPSNGFLNRRPEVRVFLGSPLCFFCRRQTRARSMALI